MNPRDWVRGCGRPRLCGANASLLKVAGANCIGDIPDIYGWGAAGGIYKAQQNHSQSDLPTPRPPDFMWRFFSVTKEWGDMKRIILCLLSIFIGTTAIAHTINWYVDGNILHTTTCESGDDITPPTAPEKYGYTFKEWLPYIPIEYLESTGTQWIDTLYKPTKSQILEINYQFLSHGIFGCNRFSIGQQENYTSSPWGWAVIRETPFEKHLFKFDAAKNYVYRDNRLVCNNCTEISSCTETYKIFQNNTGRFYGLKIQQNNTLIKNFVPALDQNDTPCIYDLVENKFYYNAGTGNFIAGPIIGTTNE